MLIPFLLAASLIWLQVIFICTLGGPGLRRMQKEKWWTGEI
jgi:hypothetical protein